MTFASVPRRGGRRRGAACAGAPAHGRRGPAIALRHRRSAAVSARLGLAGGGAAAGLGAAGAAGAVPPGCQIPCQRRPAASACRRRPRCGRSERAKRPAMIPSPSVRGPAALLGGLACVLLLGAAPAAAQGNTVIPPSGPAGACGQPMALTHQLARPVDQTGTAPVELALDRQEPRYVEFTVAGTARVTLRTRSATGSDTFLAVFDAAGRVVATDDDSGGDLQALIEGLTLAPGAYCAQVRTYGWSEPVAVRATLEVSVPGVGSGIAGPDLSRPCGDPDRKSVV